MKDETGMRIWMLFLFIFIPVTRERSEHNVGHRGTKAG